MYCSQCGREAKLDARFCAACGAPLHKLQPQRELARGTGSDEGSAKEPILEARRPQLPSELGFQAAADSRAADLKRPRVVEPPLPLRATSPRNSAKALSWLGIFGAGIGGYVYMTVPASGSNCISGYLFPRPCEKLRDWLHYEV
ncbi:MAG: zinc-ribbon domain-containing protein [bacterium]